MTTKAQPALVILAGATLPSDSLYQSEVEEIAIEGMTTLQEQEAAIEAVEVALAYTEDNPLFNCGTGSRLNLEGDAEMDACIVNGATGKSGAVASIGRVRNPIVIARRVMEETDHSLLAGQGAVEFARALGFQDYDPIIESRKKEWEELRHSLTAGKEMPEPLHKIVAYWTKLHAWAKRDGDTVAVLALDPHGHMAAGISSGGAPLKLPGRVGDAAIAGAGVYARNGWGAAALTGHGEVFMRVFAARWLCEQMGAGATPQEATEQLLAKLDTEAPGAVAVAIALDSFGQVGGSRNVVTGPHVCVTGEGKRISDFARVSL